jgi:hypothetical protein
MKKLSVLAFASVLLIFGGCKKEGPAGPTGATGSAGSNYSMPSDGYIKGTITGTRADGITPINISFNHAYYQSIGTMTPGGWWVDTAFSFTRYNGSVQSSQNNNISLYFDITNLSSSTPSVWASTTAGQFWQNDGNTKIFDFSFNSSSTITITNFSYNNSTGVVSGSFTVNISSTSTGYPATITGTFQATLKEYVQKTNSSGGEN